MRSNQIVLQDGDLAISTFQKRAANIKEINIDLQLELEKTRRDYLHLMHNLQTQIVMRKGLVEVPLTGDIKDFEDAILVPKSELDKLNTDIKVVNFTYLT